MYKPSLITQKKYGNANKMIEKKIYIIVSKISNI